MSRSGLYCHLCGRLIGLTARGEKDVAIFCPDRPCYLMPTGRKGGSSGVTSTRLVSLLESGVTPKTLTQSFGAAPQWVSASKKSVRERWRNYT